MKIDMAAYIVNLVAIGVIGFLGGRLYGIRQARAALMRNVRTIQQGAIKHLGELDRQDPEYPVTYEFIRGQVNMAEFLLKGPLGDSQPPKGKETPPGNTEM